MSDLARTPVAQAARQIRNPAAGGVLQRQCACGQHTTAGGECEACKQKREGTLQRAAISPAPVHEVPPIVHEVLRSPGQPLDAGTRAFVEPRFGHDFSQVPLHATTPARIQPKLIVNSPGDIYEQEADRVAEQVLAAPAHPAVGGAPPHIQRYAGQATEGSNTAPASVDRALASSSRPLEPVLRQDMEQGFGHDFSQVRVHSGTAAEQSARDVSANAYTVGHDIVFGAGRFAPQTSQGRRLLAHELTHVVQQSGAHGTLANQGLGQTLQRDLGFEFQLRDNTITTDKGRSFPRKAGKFFHKVPPADKHGLELQTDTGSVMEFETHHLQKWSDLEAQIQSAVDVVQEIKKDPKAFPFNQEVRFHKEGLLAKGEKLQVDIKDSAFVADIQSTEGIALTQYPSLLKEHESNPAEFIDPVLKDAQDILNAASTASKSIKAGANLDNLRGFLQIILNYVRRGQHVLWDKTDPGVVKATFRLMIRVDFSSVFRDLLNADEKKLFGEIVKSDAIPKAVGIAASDPFFKTGYWGDLGGGKHGFFEGGKVTAVSAGGKVHDCSQKAKTPGVDSSQCGIKIAGSAITVGLVAQEYCHSSNG